jgi:hypothetical protein
VQSKDVVVPVKDVVQNKAIVQGEEAIQPKQTAPARKVDDVKLAEEAARNEEQIITPVDEPSKEP